MGTTVVLMGYYGMSNFGDDLFCEVVAEAGRQHAQDLRILVAAPSEATSPGSLSFPGWMSPWWSGFGWRSSAVRVIGRTRALLGADAVVWAGGSVFTENRGVRRLHDSIGLLRSRRQYAAGVSVGPFDSAQREREVLAHLEGYDRVLVRDRASLRRSRELDQVSYCGDLGVMAQAPAGAHGDGPHHLGFAPCATATPDFGSLVPVIDAICARVRESAVAGVRVLALNSHPEVGDVELATRALDRFRQHGVEAELCVYGAGETPGVSDMVRVISSLTGLVSYRLHGAVVAYAAGVPFVLHEYHPKCRDFLDDIGQSPALRAREGAAVRHATETLLAGDTAPPAVPADDYRRHAERSLRELLGSLSVG